MSSTTPRRRLLATAGALAVVSPLLPVGAAGAAAALPPTQDPREFACPPGRVPASGFDDISGNLFALEIECLAGYGITTGVTATRYAPGEQVRRVQMAQFIARVATEVAGLTLDTSDAGFTDLGGVSPAARDAINGLANAGVVKGRTATTFQPESPVQRDQMATFLVALQDRIAAAYPAAEDYFGDDGASPHKGNVDRLAAAGVVTGKSPGVYDPLGTVTRQQMAAFVMRYVEDRIEAGDLEGKYARNNEVLAVAPTDAMTLSLVNESGSAANPADDREFSITGLRPGVRYRITLVDASVLRDEAGVTRFPDADGDDVADVGASSADIVLVNGAAVARTAGGPAAPSTATATPVDGRIELTVDGEGEERVLPVVHTDGGRSLGLDLAADDRPIEAFGLGGATTFRIPAAGSSANAPDGEVVSLSAKGAAGTFVLSTAGDARGELRYTYDANYTYRIAGTLVPQQDFLAELSRGDGVVVGGYAATSSGNSQFDLATDTPTRPATSAEKGTTEQGGDDLTVTIVPGSPAAVGSYDRFIIQRATVSGATATDEATTGTVGTWTTIAEPAATSDADGSAAGFQYVDRNVPAGAYRYRAAAVVDDDRSDYGTDPRNETSTPPATPDTAGPVAADAALTDDRAPQGTTSAGDVFRITFDEPLATPPSDALIRVRPGNASSASDTLDLRNGVNATFSVSGSVLTVTLATGVRNTAYPLTIVAQAGITDANGNNWDLAGSSDLVVDAEPAP